MLNGHRGASDILWTANIPADCNSNSVDDVFDISGSTSTDCNLNGSPDECDIATGRSEDCDTNGMPDDCIVCTTPGDCTDCDPFSGDGCLNGLCTHVVECSIRHPADLNADGSIDLSDFAIFQACFAGPDGEIPANCPFASP